MITNANAVKNVNTVPQNNNGWLKCDEMILQATTAGWALIDLNQQIVTLERQFMRKCYKQRCTSKTAMWCSLKISRYINFVCSLFLAVHVLLKPLWYMSNSRLWHLVQTLHQKNTFQYKIWFAEQMCCVYLLSIVICRVMHIYNLYSNAGQD